MENWNSEKKRNKLLIFSQTKKILSVIEQLL